MNEYKYRVQFKANMADFSTADWGVSADTVEEIKMQLNELYEAVGPDKMKLKMVQAKQMGHKAIKEVEEAKKNSLGAALHTRFPEQH